MKYIFSHPKLLKNFYNATVNNFVENYSGLLPSHNSFYWTNNEDDSY